jgi:hypothetical protein
MQPDWMWWHTSVIPATWEAEMERLGKLRRPYLIEHLLSKREALSSIPTTVK